MAENVTKKAGLATRIKKFFKESKSELKKVTWPTKEQLVHNTLVIIAFVAIVTVILSLLDLGFTKLFSLLTNIL